MVSLFLAANLYFLTQADGFGILGIGFWFTLVGTAISFIGSSFVRQTSA